MNHIKVCTVCKDVFRPHKGEKILFSSGNTEWRIDFRWPSDVCELCAMITGLEDYCEMVLDRGGVSGSD